jgi:hypothetical protein
MNYRELESKNSLSGTAGGDNDNDVFVAEAAVAVDVEKAGRGGRDIIDCLYNPEEGAMAVRIVGGGDNRGGGGR